MDAARQASDARAKDLWARAVQDAFAAAENAHGMWLAAKGIAAKLLPLSPGKTPMGRLKARRTPLHPTGLTRSPSRVINHASRQHLQRERGASRAMEATDSRALHRSTSMWRRDRTLPLLNAYVAEVGPLHFPGVECPPESDTKAHNDYKAKVILASDDSSLKAGMLLKLKARIDRIVHYTSVYDAVMRRHRTEVLARRKSTYAKIMAAVTLRATGGTIRGLAAFHRLEQKSSGCVSAVANVSEAGEGRRLCGSMSRATLTFTSCRTDTA